MARLEPPRDAVEMKRVITYPPGDRALLAGRRSLIGLTFDTEVHDVVAANGAVVHLDERREKKEKGENDK